MDSAINNAGESCPKIGIDKIKFYNFGLDKKDGIDYAKLTQNRCVKIETAGEMAHIRCLPDGTGIKRIIIKDNKIFSDLVIGCKINNFGKLYEYIHLTLTVTYARGNNLVPMSYPEYTDHLEKVLMYISDHYGIRLVADDIKINYIEVNTNISLSQAFENYSRALKHLMSFPESSLKKMSTYEEVEKDKSKTTLNPESYMRGNESIELIMYNKSKQMKDTEMVLDDKEEDCPPQFLRIEYRLLNSKKIGAEFGTTSWMELNDTIIANWFVEKFQKQVIKRHQKWELQKKKELLKLIKFCRDKNSKTWHSLLMQEIRNRAELHGCPYILDIEQVYDAIRCIPNSSRYCTRTIKAIDKIKIENDVYKNNDIAKINEIFSNLELAYDSSVPKDL